MASYFFADGKGVLDDFTPDPERYPIPPVPVVPSSETCNHTATPNGYMEWHIWAEEASKTHDAVRCPHCSLYAIWMPKAEAEAWEAKSLREAIERSDRVKAEAVQRYEARKLAKATKKRKDRE